MDFRERVAHHEAAHAVIAVAMGAGVASAGIDLDAVTSVQGAFGNAAVNLIDLKAVPQGDVVKFLFMNLMITCAGAASDAKIESRTLIDALKAQPGDYRVARDMLVDQGVTSDTEIDSCLIDVLKEVKIKLDKPEIWAAVEAVANACITNGGKLSSTDIASLTSTIP